MKEDGSWTYLKHIWWVGEDWKTGLDVWKLQIAVAVPAAAVPWCIFLPRSQTACSSEGVLSPLRVVDEKEENWRAIISQSQPCTLTSLASSCSSRSCHKSVTVSSSADGWWFSLVARGDWKFLESQVNWAEIILKNERHLCSYRLYVDPILLKQ